MNLSLTTVGKMGLISMMMVLIFSSYSQAQSLNSSIVIAGKTNEKDNHYLLIAKPINGTTFHGFHERYAIHESGDFNFRLDLEQEGFVKLEYHLSAYKAISAYLYMQPGDSCYIEFDPTSETEKYKITGSNSAGQNHYNSRRKGMNPRDLSFGKTFQYSDSLNAEELIDSIQKTLDNEIYLLEELYHANMIDSRFYSGVSNDYRYFYAYFAVEIIQNAYFSTTMPMDHPKYRSEFLAGYAKLWQTIFDSVPPTQLNATYSTWFHNPGLYAYSYMWYNGFYLPQIKGEFDKDKMNENLWDYLFDSYQISFSGKNLEFSLATYLWTSTFQRYDIEFLELFEEYRRLFPNSKYQTYLTQSEDRIRKFHNLANASDESQNRYSELPPINLDKNYLDEISFADSIQSITSLKQAIAPYRGKVVYIDVWATWCGPCITEFHYNPQLKEFLQSNNVEMLYISIDKDAYHEKWKDFIKVYNLTGYHIRASEELINNINQITGKSAIPWYFIVDKEGNLVERNAFRPGMEQKLYNQILKYCQ